MLKKLCLLLAVLFIIANFAACGQSGKTDGSASSGTTKTSDSSGTKPATSTPGTKDTKSSDEVVTFTWFRPQINRNAIVYWNDALWVQELEKRMNVKINFKVHWSEQQVRTIYRLSRSFLIPATILMCCFSTVTTTAAVLPEQSKTE